MQFYSETERQKLKGPCLEFLVPHISVYGKIDVERTPLRVEQTITYLATMPNCMPSGNHAKACIKQAQY